MQSLYGYDITLYYRSVRLYDTIHNTTNTLFCRPTCIYPKMYRLEIIPKSSVNSKIGIFCFWRHIFI